MTLTLMLGVALLLFLTILALTLLVVLERAKRQPGQAAELAARQQKAVWASATVLNWRRQPNPHPEQRQVRLDLRLQVQPPEGPAYAVIAIWRVDLEALPRLQPGAHVSVKIDQQDPHRIYPNISGAEPWAFRSG